MTGSARDRMNLAWDDMRHRTLSSTTPSVFRPAHARTGHVMIALDAFALAIRRAIPRALTPAVITARALHARWGR
jgi:hypothetical protein